MSSNPSPAKQTVNKETFVQDLALAMQDKWEQKKINAAVAALSEDAGAYPATAVISRNQIRVTITGGKTFTGSGAFMSSQSITGVVFTGDVEKLYAQTASFEFIATPVYVSVLFFDSNSNLLGYFQCGAISTVTGIGGGKGSWA